MNDELELLECDGCGEVKPIDAFHSPGHRSGGRAFGYDIGSDVCAACGKKLYEQFQEELAQDIMAEIANDEKAAQMAAEEGREGL